MKEDDIQYNLLNLVYVDVGPYPAIIPEETFLTATARLIQEMGAAEYAAQVRSIPIEQGLNIPKELNRPCDPPGDPVETARQILVMIRKANPPILRTTNNLD